MGPRSGCTHIFQTAQEVVADRGAWQVGRVQTASDVEEIIGAQHGVVLLSVACGGENPIHQDCHLEEPQQEQGMSNINNRTWRDSYKKNRLIF